MTTNEDCIRVGVARFLVKRKKRWDQYTQEDAEEFINGALRGTDVGWRVYGCLAMLATHEIEEAQNEVWGYHR